MDEKYEVKQKLTQMKNEKKNRDEECSQLNESIKILQDELNVISLPFEENIAKLEYEIKELMLNVGESVRTLDGEVTFRRDYDRISYNSKALDAICNDNSFVKTLIKPYRKVSHIDASSSIKTF